MKVKRMLRPDLRVARRWETISRYSQMGKVTPHPSTPNTSHLQCFVSINLRRSATENYSVSDATVNLKKFTCIRLTD